MSSQAKEHVSARDDKGKVGAAQKKFQMGRVEDGSYAVLVNYESTSFPVLGEMQPPG